MQWYIWWIISPDLSTHFVYALEYASVSMQSMYLDALHFEFCSFFGPGSRLRECETQKVFSPAYFTCVFVCGSKSDPNIVRPPFSSTLFWLGVVKGKDPKIWKLPQRGGNLACSRWGALWNMLITLSRNGNTSTSHSKNVFSPVKQQTIQTPCESGIIVQMF